MIEAEKRGVTKYFVTLRLEGEVLVSTAPPPSPPLVQLPEFVCVPNRAIFLHSERTAN